MKEAVEVTVKKVEEVEEDEQEAVVKKIIIYVIIPLVVCVAWDPLYLHFSIS